MTKQDAPDSREPRIPTEADWGDYRADLDQNWAHDHYCGRSNEEMQKRFHSNPIEATDELRFMPEIPFRYYMIGYKDYVMAGVFDLCDSCDAASCFLSLVIEKLEEQPRYIVPIMPELLPALKYVAENQAKFEADESIYGTFPEKFEKIQILYAACKDRYRRYP